MTKQELSNIILASSRLGFNDCDRIADAIERYIDDKLNEQKEKESEKEEAKATDGRIIEWKKDFKEYINSLSIPRDDYNGIMEYIDEFPSVE